MYKLDKTITEELIGKTFECLQVIENNEDLSELKRRPFLRCKCICGNLVSVDKYQLTRNDGKGTKSCGCLGGKRDLTGEVFTRLRVLGKNEELSKLKKCTVYDCVCDCGERVSVPHGQLTGGSTKSCGCLLRERAAANGRNNKSNLLGQKFTNLLVIEEVGRAKTGHVLWKCLCSCGNHVTVEGYKLKNKNVQSCGCLLLIGRPRLDEEISGRRKIFGSYRCRGLREFGEFTLTEEEFYTLIKQPCFYCGCPPSERAIMRRKKTNEPLLFAYNGLDRINSELGYSTANVVPCCWVCNKMKLDQESTEFLNRIKQISKNLKL